MRTGIIHIICTIVGLLIAGCSGAPHPDNPEPSIEMLQASGLTRNEATLSATVVTHGSGKLSYMKFYYWETDKTGTIKEAVADDPAKPAVRLQGLKAGTSYSCYAEGGTATATLRSEQLTFITLPNDRPQISEGVPLSIGSIGIIVGFEILDDGGEPITEAGCDIKNTVTGEPRRIYVLNKLTAPASYRLPIHDLTIDTRYIITPFAANSLGETKGVPFELVTRSSLILDEPGLLAELLGTHVALRKLVVSGKMNGTDFSYLRQLLGAPILPGQSPVESTVSEVDLSDVTIMEGGASFDGKRFTVADEISTGMFADCVNLHDILLPTSAKCLARDAFSGCSSLESLTISADIVSLHPSSPCVALKSIEVSPANQKFAAVDGVLFNHAVSEILWFPPAKTGAYTLPSTITSIGENAFTGTSITSLEIPESVTSIGRGAFYGSMISTIFLPDKITNISEAMFQNCSQLKEVHLGSKTEFIGNYAFSGSGILKLYVASPIPPYASASAFVNQPVSITETCTLYVPYGTKSVYRNHSQWSKFRNIEEF